MAINTDIFTKIASTDYFFFYGEGSIDPHDECKSDLMQLLVQPQRSMFFFRSNGAGVKSFENFPIGLTMQIGIPYAISSSIANRNTIVSDGTDIYPDRRISTSQDAINFTIDENKNIDIAVSYLLYMDVKNQGDQKKPQNIKISTAGIQ